MTAPAGVDRQVTVTLNTVRDNDAQFPGHDVLRSVAGDLAAQRFPPEQLELVIVDGLHPWRAETFRAGDYPFRVVHVPPRQTTAVRARRCAISAYKNTALAHCRGELVVTLDDCASIDPDFIARAWAAWSGERLCLGALYREAHSGPDVRTPEWGHDSRAGHYLDKNGKCVGPWQGNPQAPPMYGFTAFPLQAALDVNGYDEMFDGAQGLEDVDMGIRIQKAGYRVALDMRHLVTLLGPSPPWSPRLFDEGVDRNAKCNQTTLRIAQARGRLRANEAPWSDGEWQKVAPRCYLLGPGNCCTLHAPGTPCDRIGSCADVEHPGLAELRASPSIFQLADLRMQALASLQVAP